MEIRHQKHLPKSREKKWTHYLGQFLMIWLVTIWGRRQMIIRPTRLTAYLNYENLNHEMQMLLRRKFDLD